MKKFFNFLKKEKEEIEEKEDNLFFGIQDKMQLFFNTAKDSVIDTTDVVKQNYESIDARENFYKALNSISIPMVISVVKASMMLFPILGVLIPVLQVLEKHKQNINNPLIDNEQSEMEVNSEISELLKNVDMGDVISLLENLPFTESMSGKLLLGFLKTFK